MALKNFEIRLQGPDAETLAAELAELIKKEFGENPRMRKDQARKSPGNEPDKTDPIAVAALVLSIPSALLATMDLAARLKVSQKLTALIQWAKEKRKSGPDTGLDMVHPDGKVCALDEESVNELIDAAAKVSELM